MTRRVKLAILLTAAACGAPGGFTSSITSNASATAPAEITLPTMRCGDYFIASAMLNGRGPYRLLLDTGFPRTQLAARVAGALDVRRRLDSIRIGGLIVRGRIPINARELDHLSHALGAPIDGILGYTVFQDLVQTYDFPAGAVRLGTHPLDAAEPGVVPMSTGTRPFLRARLGGRTIDLLLDTGFSGGISLLDLTAFPLADTVRRVGSSVRAEGVVFTRGARLSDDLRLDAFTVRRPVATSAARRHLLGQDILERFTVTLDRAQGLARFTPARDASLTIDVPPLHYTGLALSPRADHHEVAAVLAGSPAARAGVSTGDRIIAVDGVPVAERGCAGLETDRSQPRTLTVARGEARFEVEIVPAVIVP